LVGMTRTGGRPERCATDRSKPADTRDAYVIDKSARILPVRSQERGSMGPNTDHRGEYGKPCAVKVARTVWSGGKPVRAYLSLPL